MVIMDAMVMVVMVIMMVMVVMVVMVVMLVLTIMVNMVVRTGQDRTGQDRTGYVGKNIYLQLVIVAFRLLELTERNRLEEGSPLLFFKISFFVLETLSGLGTIYLLTKPGNHQTL